MHFLPTDNPEAVASPLVGAESVKLTKRGGELVKSWGLQAINENWHEIAWAADAIGGEQWLPRFMEGVQGKEGVHIFEPTPLFPQPAEVTLDTFESVRPALGCGHFGCVFRTYVPNTVFKFTLDESETRVAWYMKILEARGERVPYSMVKYYGAFELSSVYDYHDECWRVGPKHGNAIWREEVLFPDGKDSFDKVASHLHLDPGDEDPEFQMKQVESIWSYARVALKHACAAGLHNEAFKRGYADWLRDQMDFVENTKDNFRHYWSPGSPPNLPAEYTFASLIMAIREITMEGIEMSLISEWCEDFLYMIDGLKLLVADAHRGNVKYVNRGGKFVLVTSDPGLSVFLDPELDESLVVPSAVGL